MDLIPACLQDPVHSRPALLSPLPGPTCPTGSPFLPLQSRISRESFALFPSPPCSSPAHCHWTSILAGPRAMTLASGKGPPPQSSRFLEASSTVMSLPLPCLFPRLSPPQLTHVKRGAYEVGQREGGFQELCLEKATGLQYLPLHTRCPSTFSGSADGSLLTCPRHPSPRPHSTQELVPHICLPKTTTKH